MKKTFTATLLMALLLMFVWLAPSAIVRAEGEEDSFFQFELPIKGASGYASVKMSLLDQPNGKKLETVYPGNCFVIEGETDEYFYVKYAGPHCDIWGYLEKQKCFINLPDIIPSIVYWDSNSVSSLFRTSGEALPGITEEQLYNVKFYNSRFGEEQFVMPVLYNMACQIMVAQQAALDEGNSLKIYETFRPHDVQMNVSGTLSTLMSSNSKVYNGISSWGKGWFIATSYSNHQRGKAMDCSLVKVLNIDKTKTGKYTYSVITDYEEYAMPTAMHELSTAAVTFQYGCSKDAWQTVPLSKGMKASVGAMLLQKYCTDAGMTPLASEWWHFDGSKCPSDCKGEFRITRCRSEKP